MKSQNITAIIFAKNEEHRLPLVLSNIEEFAETIVFDGGSTDKTEQICIEKGIRFIRRPPELIETVGADIKFALSHVKTPYVLAVNCSHYYPQELLSVYRQAADEGIYAAVYNDIVIYTYGRIVHKPFLRRRAGATYFYRVSAVNYSKSIVHNEAPVEAPESHKLRLPAKDNLSIHLFRDYNVKKAETNHSFYACLDSSHRYRLGVRTSSIKIIWLPIKLFFFQYIRCGSIRYGTEGLIYTLLYVQLELNIQLKLWELQNSLDIKAIIDKNLRLRQALLNADQLIHTNPIIDG